MHTFPITQRGIKQSLLVEEGGTMKNGSIIIKIWTSVKCCIVALIAVWISNNIFYRNF